MFFTRSKLQLPFPFIFADSKDKPAAAASAGSSDQVTAAQTWWSQRSPAISPDPKLFSATHGLLQQHPLLGSIGSSLPRPAVGGSLSRATPLGSTSSLLKSNLPNVNFNSKSPFRHLDFTNSATAELRRNPNLSAPDECARACREGEPPRICYYHFTLEYYTVLGA